MKHVYEYVNGSKTKWENMHANVIIMKTERKKNAKQEKNERRREQRRKKSAIP